MGKLEKSLKKIRMHPSFVLFALWLIFCDGLAGFVSFFAAVLTHEAGHYFVARAFGYKLDNFFLAPYGAALNYKEKAFFERDEICIALAGPLTNIAFAVLCAGLWWVEPQTYGLTSEFASCSLALALFNLLPAYPMDGGRVVAAALSAHFDRQKVVRVEVALNGSFCVLFLALFVQSCASDFSPTFALAAVFLCLGAMQSKYEGKYKMIALFDKKIKQFSSPKIFVINSSQTLQKILKKIKINRHTIFYCMFFDGSIKWLDENVVKTWAKVFPLCYTVQQIWGRL